MELFERMSVSSRPVPTARVLFWARLLLALGVLALLGLVGGNYLGKHLTQGVQVREPGLQSRDDPVQPLQLGQHEQGRQLTGHGSFMAPPMSSPPALADIAAQGEVQLDDNGLVVDVPLPEDGPAYSLQLEQDVQRQMRDDARGSRFRHDDAVALATLPATPAPLPPHAPPRRPAPDADIFFGN